VDEVLSLEQERLKFAKRKLRVQRCKTLPGGTHSVKVLEHTSKPSGSTSQSSKAQKPTRTSAAIAVNVPKGDPTLGNKISHLSKDERKKVKSSDADRVARRLAKKAKALEQKGVKSKDGIGKERTRERKRPRDLGSIKSKSKPGADKPKRRVRSGTSLSRMNIKK